MSAARWAEYRDTIMDKRRAENEENERRWQQSRELFQQSQENLQSLLRGKEERSAEMLQRRDSARVTQFIVAL